MLAPKDERMSAEEFLVWATGREGRFELIDGHVVQMMTGAKQSHNVVVGNFADALRSQAKGKGCRATTSDTAVICRHDQVRYPDLVVDCGPPDPDALFASSPVLIVEVLSKSTSQIDLTNKLDEYQAIATVEAIVIVEPDIVSVKLYRRVSGNVWKPERYTDLTDDIALPMLDVSISLGALYDTLDPLPVDRA